MTFDVRLEPMYSLNLKCPYAEGTKALKDLWLKSGIGTSASVRRHKANGRPSRLWETVVNSTTVFVLLKESA